MEEMIVCRECGEPTSDPPDEMAGWRGLCPDCVIKTFIYPKCDDQEVRLLDALIGQRASMIGQGVVLAIPAGDDPASSIADIAIRAIKDTIMTNKHARDTLSELIEALNERDLTGEKPLTIEKRKVKMNNPKWS